MLCVCVCVAGFVVAETSERVRRGVDNDCHVAARVVLVLHPLSSVGAGLYSTGECPGRRCASKCMHVARHACR
jgi:hypothetical protein